MCKDMDCATDVYVVCNCHYNLCYFGGGSGEEILRYGSVERSDDDLYKMLNMSDTERVADANKGGSAKVRSSTMATLSDGESSYEGESTPITRGGHVMSEAKEKDDYSFDDFEQESSPQKVTTTSPILKGKDKEAEPEKGKPSEKLIDPAEQVRLTQLEMIMKRWSQMEVNLTDEKPVPAAAALVEERETTADLAEPDAVALNTDKDEDLNDDTQGYADDYDKEEEEGGEVSSHGRSEGRVTPDDIGAAVEAQAEELTPYNLETTRPIETLTRARADSDRESHPVVSLSLPHPPSKVNLTSSAGALRYQNRADDSHLNDSNFESIDISAPIKLTEEKPLTSNTNFNLNFSNRLEPNPTLPISSFQRGDGVISDRSDFFPTEDDSLPVPAPPPHTRPDLPSHPPLQRDNFNRPIPATQIAVSNNAPSSSALPEPNDATAQPDPAYLPYLPVPPEPEPLRYYSDRSMSQQEDDLAQQDQEEYYRNARGFTGRGLGAATAAKIQQQRLGLKMDKGAFPPQRIKVIASNLHNIGNNNKIKF